MNRNTNKFDKAQKNRILIFEMIDASIALAEKKGNHPLERGCNCISCVQKRKDLLQGKEQNWKFSL